MYSASSSSAEANRSGAKGPEKPAEANKSGREWSRWPRYYYES